ncbi:MAG: hypothetical protein HY020_25800 [Burkholderiales bacterium]|nr:hypothetical protein [Burkholderiales bacterium]
MPSRFRLFAPAPGLAAGKVALIVATGAAFKAQFAAPAAVPLFAGNAMLEISAAALDAGYGLAPCNAPGLDGAQLAALFPYLDARRQLLLSALSFVGPPTDVARASFVPGLNATEKVGLANLLGMVLCRIAASRWVAAQALGPIQRFWHLDLAEHEPVNLVQGPPALPGVQNPDFLFETPNGWFLMESKGSVGGLLWKKLREGLQQALRFGGFAFVDPNAGPLAANVVQARACSMAHFRAGDLQLTLLDPPDGPQALAATPPEEAPIPPQLVLVQAFCDLLQWELALGQFTGGDPYAVLQEHATDAPIVPIAPWPVTWRTLSDVAGRGPALSLGIWSELLTSRRALFLALKAMRHVLPVCAIPAEAVTRNVLDAPVPGLQHAIAQSLDAWTAVGEDAVAWQEALRATMQRLPPEATSRRAVIQTLIHTAALPGANSVASLADRYLDLVRNGSADARRDATTSQDEAAPGRLQLDATTHGLLVAFGTWHAAPTKQEDGEPREI